MDQAPPASSSSSTPAATAATPAPAPLPAPVPIPVPPLTQTKAPTPIPTPPLTRPTPIPTPPLTRPVPIAAPPLIKVPRPALAAEAKSPTTAEAAAGVPEPAVAKPTPTPAAAAVENPAPARPPVILRLAPPAPAVPVPVTVPTPTPTPVAIPVTVPTPTPVVVPAPKAATAPAPLPLQMPVLPTTMSSATAATIAAAARALNISTPNSAPIPPSFYRSDTTFNPSPYQPSRPYPTAPATHPSIAPPPVPGALFDKPGTGSGGAAAPFDGLLVHPPFSVLPDGVRLAPGDVMSYMVLHAHPAWFLDVRDYVTLEGAPPGAIRYPRELEPPRPKRQKDLLLRCTFCPRTYAGVNAKSMWTRHVREKHRIVLSKAWTDSAIAARKAAIASGAIVINSAGNAVPTSPSAASSPSTPSPSASGSGSASASTSAGRVMPIILPPRPSLAVSGTGTPSPPTSGSGIPKVIIPPRPVQISIPPQTAPPPLVVPPLTVPVRGKPGPKPKPRASPVKGGTGRPRGRPPKVPKSGAGAAPASASGTPTTRSTPTPESSPEPEGGMEVEGEVDKGWVRTDSPPPPEGMLPPRMRPGRAVLFRPSLGARAGEDKDKDKEGSKEKEKEKEKDGDVQMEEEGAKEEAMETESQTELDNALVADLLLIDDGEGEGADADADMDMEPDSPCAEPGPEEDTGPPPLGAAPALFGLGAPSLRDLADRDLVISPPASPAPASAGMGMELDTERSRSPSPAGSGSGVLTPTLLPTLFAVPLADGPGAAGGIVLRSAAPLGREAAAALIGRLRSAGVAVAVDGDAMDVDGQKEMQNDKEEGEGGGGAELDPALAAWAAAYVAGLGRDVGDALADVFVVGAASDAHAHPDAAGGIGMAEASGMASAVAREVGAALAGGVLALAGGLVRDGMARAAEDACVGWEWRGRALASAVEEDGADGDGDGPEVIRHPLVHLVVG
ncbi:hypothetical protein MIND_01172600 [Mycena indigotica]|uniref:Uncharacterized protein n=1 Tax=Mycena indigotica TaxID=2126181 RepID=A0A8H6VSV3_9AGAR|nr:uncharacterized protein MIND_01172600 [Mycena indigotica]KAF7292742.1 hypothetical protein MIND_01172600 [Mycena indigotica]